MCDKTGVIVESDESLNLLGTKAVISSFGENSTVEVVDAYLDNFWHRIKLAFSILRKKPKILTFAIMGYTLVKQGDDILWKKLK